MTEGEKFLGYDIGCFGCYHQKFATRAGRCIRGIVRKFENCNESEAIILNRRRCEKKARDDKEMLDD